MSEPLNTVSVFSGAGLMDEGLRDAGLNIVAQCEIEPEERAVCAAHFPAAYQHDDVRTLTAAKLSERGIARVDVLAGGFPCQDISDSKERAKGLEGQRSGLWFEMLRLANELRGLGLRYIIVENVSALARRGLGTVLEGLSRLGFDAEWTTLSASAFGAWHTRRRVFIVAYPQCAGRASPVFTVPTQCGDYLDWARCRADTVGETRIARLDRLDQIRARDGAQRVFRRVDDGLRREVGLYRALGNGVVRPVAAWLGGCVVADAAREGQHQ